MKLIKDIVGGVLNNIEKKQLHADDNVEDMWLRCVKKGIAQHTRVRTLKKAKLYINVENSAWLHEMRTKREKIASKLNRLSNNKIKDIIFRVGDTNDSR